MAVIHAITKQPRNAGRITSGAFTVPANVPVGHTVSVVALMDAADIADATLSIACGFEWSEDGGVTWNTLIAGVWQGGVKDGDQGPFAPSLGVGMDDQANSLLAGKRVRAFAQLPRALAFGMDATVS